MDTIDEKILVELQRNAKQTVAQIAKRVNIPITTVHHRIKKMEHEQLIKTYRPVLDYAKLGKGLRVLILVQAEGKANQEALARSLLKLPSVHSASIVTGGFDLLLDVRVSSVEELNTLIIGHIRGVPGVDKTQTMLVLKEYEKH